MTDNRNSSKIEEPKPGVVHPDGALADPSDSFASRAQKEGGHGDKHIEKLASLMMEIVTNINQGKLTREPDRAADQESQVARPDQEKNRPQEKATGCT